VIAARKVRGSAGGNRQKGFSLLELLVSVAILVIVAGAIIMGMIRMTWSESTIMNRTQMHSSVRNATELMQQEVGQAGRLGSSPGLTLASAIAAGSSPTVTLNSTSGTSTTGLYPGEQLVVDPSTTSEETVTISAVNAGSIQATFANAHAANVPVLVMGGIASGIVPPTTASTPTSSKLILNGNSTANTTLPDDKASDGYTLKLYGDLNGDGNMIYAVYHCTPNQAGTGKLYRYASATSDVTDPANALTLTPTLLLDNLFDTGAPCFTYQVKDQVPVMISGGQVKETFVINVAVTLTVQTQNPDAKTGVVQKETKALLNIAPRNVFEAWQLAGSPSGYMRAQPMPSNVYNNFLSRTLSY
jgi:prepilin-type N-terminal cleavage/methylation domain-containing protein